MSKFGRKIMRQTYATSPETTNRVAVINRKIHELKETVERRREDEANREGARLFGNRKQRRQRRKVEQMTAALPGLSAMMEELAESGHTSAEQVQEFAEAARQIPLVARATEPEPEETPQETFARQWMNGELY